MRDAADDSLDDGFRSKEALGAAVHIAGLMGVQFPKQE
jgi:hypothetical protein